jgi:hypothetical protein
VSEPVITAVITGFISALGTFISVAAFVGRRIDRVDDDIHALDEKFDRKFDILMLEPLRHVRKGHPPNQAA